MQKSEKARKIILEAKEAQENATKIILEAQKMKEAIAQQSGVDMGRGNEISMIPFAAYEMQQDRNDAEKEKIRKSYRKIIFAISSVLLVLIIGIFSLIFYFLSNYEIATYEQDVETGNANYIGNDGDIVYGEADYSDWQTKEETENERNGN